MTGFIGKKFELKEFLREPRGDDSDVDFNLRICNYNSEIANAINEKKCDDLFIVSDENYKKIDRVDVSEEFIKVSKFSEIKFLLKLSNSID